MQFQPEAPQQDYMDKFREPMERGIDKYFNHHHAKYMAENAANQRVDRAQYPKMKYFVDESGVLQNLTVYTPEQESALEFETFEGPVEAKAAAKAGKSQKK